MQMVQVKLFIMIKPDIKGKFKWEKEKDLENFGIKMEVIIEEIGLMILKMDMESYIIIKIY